MVKDGEDWHGLQTTKLKNLGWTFQTVQPWLCFFNITGQRTKAGHVTKCDQRLVKRLGILK